MELITITSPEELNIFTNLIKKYAEKHKNDNSKLKILKKILQEARQKLQNEIKVEIEARNYLDELYLKIHNNNVSKYFINPSIV